MRYVLLLVCFSAAIPALADRWEIEIVDPLEQRPYYKTTLVTDSTSSPHVLYDDQENARIRYKKRSGSAWELKLEVDIVYISHRALALDGNDVPHIVYSDPVTDSLIYTKCENESWQTEVIDSDQYSIRGSIRLDQSGLPHIIYYKNYDDVLMHAYLYNGYWEYEEFDTLIEPKSYDFDIDSDGILHIAYSDTELTQWHLGDTAEFIRYLKWDGAPIVDEYVASASRLHGDMCHEFMNLGEIALDSSGTPHISYYFWDYLASPPEGEGYVKIASRNGSWEYENISSINPRFGDPGSFEGIFPPLSLDSLDNFHTAYHVYFNYPGFIYYMEYGSIDGGSWDFSDFDDQTDSLGYPSIYTDNNDKRHIVYGQNLNGLTIKYAYWISAPSLYELVSPANGALIPEPITLEWEDSTSSGGDVTYDVRYSLDNSFSTYEEIIGLTESTYTFPEGDLTQGETYYWKVRAWDGEEETWSGPDDYWSFTVEVVQGTDDEGNIPTTFALYPAVPNPSDGAATIGFALPRECEVDLAVYDIKGRKLQTLAFGNHTAGEHTANMNGLSSGVYLYKLEADSFVDTKKMVVR